MFVLENRYFLHTPVLHITPSEGKTVANIFALFFLITDPDPWPIRSCQTLQKVFCLHTAHARYRQTDGRKSGLNSGAYYVTLAKNGIKLSVAFSTLLLSASLYVSKRGAY